MTAQLKYTWSSLDYEQGLCRLDQIGGPRHSAPDNQPLDEELVDLNDQLISTPKQLRKDVLEAYKRLGGVKYLMRNPLLLEKLLVKIVAEDIKPVPPQSLTINLPWIQAGRLSYKDELVDIAPALEANKQLEEKLKD